jgi:SAM-dependent methyltransferase
MDKWLSQRAYSERVYAAGSRPHATSRDPLTQYIVRWRIEESIRRLGQAANGRLSPQSRILALCAGEGLEGSVLCDLGFTNVTVSDISEAGVAAATQRDGRLQGLVLNAEDNRLADGSFDLVIVQDGLHHLRSPVRGLTEMLRIAAVASIFLEPHDALVDKLIGTTWERHGEAVTYVFRWTRKLVDDVAASYLGPDSFDNLSFSFWHHNPSFARLGQRMGGGPAALLTIKAVKYALDHALSSQGNQFCGLILKRSR